MLKVEGLSTGYGQAQVLFDVSLEVEAGEIVCLLGRNGAGKTTFLKAIMGLLPAWEGEVRMGGQVISRLPAHTTIRQGIGYIPQGRRLFTDLTVRQNLEVGLMAGSAAPAAMLARIHSLFPRLSERAHQRAGTLSGGEQQMLATARALAAGPRLLLLDEPTEGLQPSMARLIGDVVESMRGEGLGVLLVEQHPETVLALADRVVFLETGRIVEQAGIDNLRDNPAKLSQYLGV